MTDPKQVAMWEMIYLVKIEQLLKSLNVEVSIRNIHLVADLMKDAILDSHEPTKP